MNDIKQNVVTNYWNNVIAEPEIDGIFPMGRCGLVEIYYRGYLEYKNFRKLVRLNKSANILEIGCGGGRWALALHSYVNHYTGIDISKKMIDFAAQQVKEKNIKNCDFICTSVQDLKSDLLYDVIYFSGVSQYMPDDELKKNINYLKKFLTKTGIIIDRSTISLEDKGTSIENPEYFSIYRTEKEISKIYSEQGYKKKLSKVSYRFLRFPRLFERINKNPVIVNTIKKTKFVSFATLNLITAVMDFFKPKVSFEKGIGKYSHVFSIFTQ